MNILIIGSGGREHALAWKVRQSDRLRRLYCIPGNPGIAELAECVQPASTDLKEYVQFVREHDIDMTIVGPEQPLAMGLVDLFEEHGLRIFGPTRNAAQLEWSKAFAKAFMQRHHIPTADFRVFTSGESELAGPYLRSVSYPAVLKEDGLAAGKGVVICADEDAAVRCFAAMMGDRKAGRSVVVEEYMTGEEASVFAICDGVNYVTLLPAQDHKRVFDRDQGKNTGGMGAYAPASVVSSDILGGVKRSIIEPTLQGLVAEGRPYSGCLYVGLMITAEGPKVVEYNCRLGDPEAQVVLPLYEGDLLDLLESVCDHRLKSFRPPAPSHGTAVCVVLASGGYPDAFQAGKPIEGIENLRTLEGVVAFHAGTKKEKGTLVTAGGRVLGITAIMPSGGLQQTIKRAYEGVHRVTFDGMHYRTDIGAKGLHPQSPAQQGDQRMDKTTAGTP